MSKSVKIDYSRTYNAMIIDSDFESIVNLRKVLGKGFENLSISHALNYESALKTIEKEHFDLVFLNIDSTDRDYEQILENITVLIPTVIIMSAERDNVFRFLMRNDVGFIIKPFFDSNILSAVTKALQKVELTLLYERSQSGAGVSSSQPAQAVDYIAIGSVGKIDVIRIRDIMYCMAEGKYTFFYTTHGKYVASRNLGDYSKNLDPQHFFRVHHSYIVNMHYVVKIERKDGSYCVLQNGITVPFSKRRQEDFIKFIKLKS